jgi:hypothetical protein
MYQWQSDTPCEIAPGIGQHHGTHAPAGRSYALFNALTELEALAPNATPRGISNGICMASHV